MVVNDEGIDADQDDGSFHDDDALADALAEEYSRLTGAISIVTPETAAAWGEEALDEPERGENHADDLAADGPANDSDIADGLGVDVPNAETPPTSPDSPASTPPPLVHAVEQAEPTPRRGPAEAPGFWEPQQVSSGYADADTGSIEPTTPAASVYDSSTTEATTADSLIEPVPGVPSLQDSDSSDATENSPEAEPETEPGDDEPVNRQLVDREPWSSFPAPDPSQAVFLAEGPPISSIPSFDGPIDPPPATSSRWEPRSRTPDATQVADHSIEDTFPRSTGEPSIHGDHNTADPAPMDDDTDPSRSGPNGDRSSDDPADQVPAGGEPDDEESDSGPGQADLPDSEPFPWIASAEAAAAVAPLAPPTDGDPFSWSITESGKVSHSDDIPFDEAAAGVEEGSDPVVRDGRSAVRTSAGPDDALLTAATIPSMASQDSITILNRAFDDELEDDVDDTDRAFSGIDLPFSEPISTARIPHDEPVLFDDGSARPRAFSLETSGPEPTELDQRTGEATRLFWLWFAANSSVISVGVGAAVFALGMSLRQSVIAVIAGIALSAIPLAFTTLAGKRSGQPTMIVSRATFGVLGNVVPAAVALLSRSFWGALLLWIAASAAASVILGAATGDSERIVVIVVAVVIAVSIAVTVAYFGYPLLSRLQLIVSIAATVLVVVTIAFTAQSIDIGEALTVPDGSWYLIVGGSVLVFSFVGLAWANSGADVARYQRPGSGDGTSMAWSSVGAALPALVLVGYGSMLAASDVAIGRGLAEDPVGTLADLLPDWFGVILIAAVSLSLIFGASVSVYSGGFALRAAGLRLRRGRAVLVVGALLLAISVTMSIGITGGLIEALRDAATTLAVPTAAWIGIFAAELMMRRRRFEPRSLLAAGGIYPDVRWVNVVGFVVITFIGFSLTSGTAAWLGWQGFGFALAGVSRSSDLGASDIGILVALVLGFLLPLVTALREIRRQENAEA